MNKKDNRLYFRKYVDEDFEKASHLRNLLSSNSSISRKRASEEEYYRWKILDNPLQSNLFHVADDNNAVVGMITATPKRVIIKKKSIKGIEICDAFVHSDYQRQGIFSRLVNSLRESVLNEGEFEFIYSTPIKDSNSLSGFKKKCNFLKVPSVNVFSLVCPFNITKILKTYFHVSSIPNFISNMIDPVLSLAYRTFYSERSSFGVENGLQFSLVTSFSEDIYELCKKISTNYDWIIERSREYLDWRFIKNPDSYSIWLVKDNEKAVGYMVLKIGTWQNLIVGYIVDFLIDEARPDIFTKMISHAFSLFLKTGVDMVSVWAVKDSFYYNILKHFGFQLYKKASLICYPNEIGNQVLNQELKWHFTMADTDII